MKTLIFKTLAFLNVIITKSKIYHTHVTLHMCILNEYINRVMDFMTQIMRCVKYELIKGNQNHYHFLRSKMVPANRVLS